MGPEPPVRRADTNEENHMGKGDKKTRKGKINRGSYGKTRPKKRPAQRRAEQAKRRAAAAAGAARGR